ncbi:MAG TPA: hypothetical protein PKD68_01165 [Candidatus Saccharibacteria bacterium]|nr:hypothetical protein [Candidatus Saccharibacteria bacterium]
MDPTYKGLPTPVPTAQFKRGPNLKLILLIAGGFLVLITVLGLLFSRGGGNTNEQQQLLYRLDALLTLTTSAKKSLTDDNLQKINAEITLVLTGDQTEVKAAIPTAKSSKALTALKEAEADTATAEKLTAAAQNGAYNTTYEEVLTQKLSSLYTLSVKVNQEASSKKLKTATATMNEHLSVYYNQLTAL